VDINNFNKTFILDKLVTITSDMKNQANLDENPFCIHTINDSCGVELGRITHCKNSYSAFHI